MIIHIYNLFHRLIPIKHYVFDSEEAEVRVINYRLSYIFSLWNNAACFHLIFLTDTH